MQKVILTVESNENAWADDFYLNDFQMTVKELRLQTLHDEKEKGMTKSEFCKLMKEWKETFLRT